MKVRTYSGKLTSVANAIVRDCTPDPDSHELPRGRAAEMADRTARKLGELIEVLADKGILTRDMLSEGGEIVDDNA